MQKRRLGRTNLQTSIIGFGGTWLAQLKPDEATAVVKKALDSGINYFDAARWDGDSEEKIGTALEGSRDKCIIATKTGSRTKRESLDDLKESMQKLRTNKLDIIQLHGIDDEKILDKAMSSDGSLQTCKEARQKGLVNFIGITGHKPRILTKAVKSGEFDVVLVPINVVTRQALEELLPTAKKLDVGVAVMKPYSAKTSNLITCLYKPSLSLLNDEPELKALLGNDNTAMVNTALKYVLAQDVSVVIPGYSRVNEVEVAAEVGVNYTGLTNAEESLLSLDLGDYCRDCGECQPCLQNVNVPAILRFYLFAKTFGLKNWAKKLYRAQEVSIERCTKCYECEQRCPYHLSIVKMLQKAKIDLQ
ncbi:MAG TPA: aldo/keto reductase [Candidatus Sulfotelmatobacter sp.]|nr:aldo/keto reductase [Candidatus Sulfotelmatobacter sp.]